MICHQPPTAASRVYARKSFRNITVGRQEKEARYSGARRLRHATLRRRFEAGASKPRKTSNRRRAVRVRCACAAQATASSRGR